MWKRYLHNHLKISKMVKIVDCSYSLLFLIIDRNHLKTVRYKNIIFIVISLLIIFLLYFYALSIRSSKYIQILLSFHYNIFMSLIDKLIVQYLIYSAKLFLIAIERFYTAIERIILQASILNIISFVLGFSLYSKEFFQE